MCGVVPEKGAKLLDNSFLNYCQLVQKSLPLIPGLQIQDDMAVDKTAKQIGDQTVLPQFWINCPRMMQKVNLPVKSRQSVAKKTFLSFYSSNEGRKLDNFLAAIEVRSRTIKLEGCPLTANVSQFISSWIQIWQIGPLCLLLAPSGALVLMMVHYISKATFSDFHSVH